MSSCARTHAVSGRWSRCARCPHRRPSGAASGRSLVVLPTSERELGLRGRTGRLCRRRIRFEPQNQCTPNPFGLFNVHGDVWEWTRDGYEPYDGASANEDPSAPWGGFKPIVRGGGFSAAASDARSAARRIVDPGFAGNSVGLRPARSISQ